MALDRIPFHQNEQFLSVDQNALQALHERYLHDLAGFMGEGVALSAWGGAAAPDYTPAALVLGGLALSVSGSTVIIGPGAFVTRYGHEHGDATAPPEAPILSGTQLVVNPAAQTLPLPAPAGPTWYLMTGTVVIEAEDAPVSRRVYDSDAETWASQPLVKRTRAAMQLYIREGDATGLPVLLSDEVPLWAFYRAGGGGGLDADHDAIDLRPLAPPRRATNTGMVALVHNQWRTLTATTLRLNAHVEFDQYTLHAVGEVDPLDVMDPLDSAPVANEWRYLYLAPLEQGGQATTPRHAQEGLTQQGVLVLSSKAPGAAGTVGARRNSVALNLPTPFRNAPVAIGRAALIGAVKRNAADDGWQSVNMQGDRAIVEQDMIALGTGDHVLDGLGLTTALSRAPIGTVAVDLLLQNDGDAVDFVYVESSATYRLGELVNLTFHVADVEVAAGGGVALTYSGSGSGFLHSVRAYRI